ncbi:hypothetical protein [Caballeronia sp. HLA56]
MRLSTHSFLALLFVSCALFVTRSFANVSADVTAQLPGGQVLQFSDHLSGTNELRFGSGWARARLKLKTGDWLRFLPDESLSINGGVVFNGVSARSLSFSGRYLVLPLVRQGMLESAGKEPRIVGNQYCPVVDTSSGCMISFETGAICSGAWSQQKDAWIEQGRDRSGEMLQGQEDLANQLWTDFRKSPKSGTLRDRVVDALGIENLISCDSPSNDNRHTYRQIAAALRREGAASDATYIENKLAKVSNEREGKLALDTRVRIKSWLYDSPEALARTTAYLVPGDRVKVLGVSKDGWVKTEYTQANGKKIKKWILKSTLDE